MKSILFGLIFGLMSLMNTIKLRSEGFVSFECIDKMPVCSCVVAFRFRVIPPSDDQIVIILRLIVVNILVVRMDAERVFVWMMWKVSVKGCDVLVHDIFFACLPITVHINESASNLLLGCNTTENHSTQIASDDF